MSQLSAFCDLPQSSFPLTIEFVTAASDTVVHTITVDGPGMVRVPKLVGEHGPVRARLTFADGEVVSSDEVQRGCG